MGLEALRRHDAQLRQRLQHQLDAKGQQDEPKNLLEHLQNRLREVLRNTCGEQHQPQVNDQDCYRYANGEISAGTARGEMASRSGSLMCVGGESSLGPPNTIATATTKYVTPTPTTITT